MNRNSVLNSILDAVQAELDVEGTPSPEVMGDDTPLLGDGSSLDSLGLVSVIVAVEQFVQEDYGLAITIVDERAMSQRNSPFRTAGSLTDYTMHLVEDAERGQ